MNGDYDDGLVNQHGEYIPPDQRGPVHTTVSAVQFFGQRSTWPEHAVYVGMPGRPSAAFGIPDSEGLFGKPWKALDHPLGWPTGYLRYLVNRLANDRDFNQAVRNLHGKTLLCWCAKKDAPRCHAMILAEFAEMLYHAEKGN